MSTRFGMHHVAYACRDLEATNRFYTELMGMPLVYTEVKRFPEGGWMKHVFFDVGDGSCIAFFNFEGVGEQPGWHSEVSTGNGLPVWVNHIAFDADADRQAQVKARMDDAGVKPLMEIDHGWCHSLYYLDPNGIMVEFCRNTPGLTPDPQAALELMREPIA